MWNSTTAALVQHLESQNAPRAAARLSAACGHERLKAESTEEYTVPCESVLLVECAAMAARFANELRAEVLQGSPTTIALDLEWRPDGAHSRHQPSLLQLATTTRVWLLDLEVPACSSELLVDVIAAVLASSEQCLAHDTNLNAPAPAPSFW